MAAFFLNSFGVENQMAANSITYVLLHCITPCNAVLPSGVYSWHPIRMNIACPPFYERLILRQKKWA